MGYMSGHPRELVKFEKKRREEKRRHTLSYLCSFLRLARPPQRSDEPRNKRRFERMEPKRENFTTFILFL